MDFKNIRKALHELIETNIDASKGYLELANASSANNLRDWLQKFSVQRKSFVESLELELARLGGKIDSDSEDGTFLGAIHRTWISIRVNASDDDLEVIINEIERGEQSAIDEYKNVLKDIDMPRETLHLIVGQLDSIQHTLGSLEHIREDLRK